MDNYGQMDSGGVETGNWAEVHDGEREMDRDGRL
jgi:hypothetical protein